MRQTILQALFWAGMSRAALEVDLTSADSIKAAAALKAHDVMLYYKGNLPGATPGILPGPPPDGDYYWWEAGALWGTLVDYWHFTGDSTYNSVSGDSLLFQAGAPEYVYMPPNWTASLGNDDQGFWGMSAMLAAEVNFPDPPDGEPGWLALAQGVFNTQASPDRHDDACGGGIRWQIPTMNNGYDYKNSIVNGIFFNMGARLARYTSNTTYLDWARKTWAWELGVGFMDADYNVYDGAHVPQNCTDIAKVQYSYNAAVWLQGAAFMYNQTSGSEQEQWKAHLTGLVNRTLTYFFKDGVAVEPSCELQDRVSCTTDMLSFKGYLHRWLAQTTQIAPFTHDSIMPVLKTSAAAAVNTCSGGSSGRECGFRWTTGSYEGPSGAGQEMNVLAALSSLLLDVDLQPQLGNQSVGAPVTNTTGGTSQGNNNAGADPDETARNARVERPITTADKAGAGVLTGFTLLFVLAAVVFVCAEMGEGGSDFSGTDLRMVQARGIYSAEGTEKIVGREAGGMTGSFI